MHPQDELFNLIKSLSPSEKRYFRINSARHILGEKNRYEMLFDFYDRWPADTPFDEEEFKKLIEDEDFGKNLASDKNYLHSIIMEAMRAFHAEKGPEQKIASLLADETFYRSKRLNRLRLKTIEKAKELAWKYELFPLLVTILQRETSARIELQQDSLDKNSAAIEKEANKALELLNVAAALERLHVKVVSSAIQNLSDSKNTQKVAGEALASDLIKQYKPGKSFTCDRLYYQIHGICLNILRDGTGCYNAMLHVYELYQKHPNFRERYADNYKIHIYNFLGICLTIEKYDLFTKLLAEAKTLKPQHRDEEGNDWQNIMHLELMYYIDTGAYEKGYSLQNEIEHGLIKYRNKVNAARRIVICRNLVICLMIVGDYGKAHNYINLILNDKSEARKDIKNVCKMIEVMLHYQMGNYTLIEPAIRNIQRTITKDRDYTEHELFFFNVFRQLLKVLPNKPSKGAITEMVNKWEEIDSLNNGIVPTEFGMWLNNMVSPPVVISNKQPQIIYK